MVSARDQRVLDAGYREWGVAAMYAAPQGSGQPDVPCRVIFTKDGRLTSAEPPQMVHIMAAKMRLAMTPVVILVQASQCTPEEGGVFSTGALSGGVFTPDGKSYEIGQAPDFYDSNAYEWRCITALGVP